MPVASKVVVTNRTAMKAKYGAAGWSSVRRALRGLIAADKARGIATRVIAIDGAADMRRVGGRAVTAAGDVAAVKAAIDAIATHAPVDYLMILGAPDVVPQATLDNPLWTGDPQDDPDPHVPSDLPYACDAPLVPAPSAYRGPTRVVGRLPDLVGASNPSYLIGLLHRATGWTAADPPRPLSVLALSTLTWRRSTETSIAALSGAAGPVHTAPVEGPAWTKPQLGALLHFVNCHGGEFDPTWYGEKFRGQVTLPHAVEAARLTGQPVAGCVVAAECCYGAMHWDPAAAGGQPSIAATYLGEGALGVFGASTVAYGPAVGNANADLITRMFLETVAAGGSLGRAALTARQRFVAHAATLDPADLKTLAQFDLLGDPSVHAIAEQAVGEPHARPRRAPARRRVARAGAPLPSGDLESPPPGVRQRRSALESIGRALEASVETAGAEPRARAGLSRARMSELSGIDLAGAAVRTFDAEGPSRAARGLPAPRAAAPSYHVAFARTRTRRSLVLVRTEPGQAPVVRRLERK